MGSVGEGLTPEQNWVLVEWEKQEVTIAISLQPMASGHQEGYMGSQSLSVQIDISSAVHFSFQSLVLITLLIPSPLPPPAFPAGPFSSNPKASPSLLVLNPMFTTPLTAPRKT